MKTAPPDAPGRRARGGAHVDRSNGIRSRCGTTSCRRSGKHVVRGPPPSARASSSLAFLAAGRRFESSRGRSTASGRAVPYDRHTNMFDSAMAYPTYPEGQGPGASESSGSSPCWRSQRAPRPTRYHGLLLDSRPAGSGDQGPRQPGPRAGPARRATSGSGRQLQAHARARIEEDGRSFRSSAWSRHSATSSACTSARGTSGIGTLYLAGKLRSARRSLGSSMDSPPVKEPARVLGPVHARQRLDELSASGARHLVLIQSRSVQAQIQTATDLRPGLGGTCCGVF